MTVDIEPGVLFSWDDSKPMLSIRAGDTPTYIHDGTFIRAQRPRGWWDLRAWLRALRALNKMGRSADG